VLSRAAGLRWRGGRAPALVRGGALVLHGVNRLLSTEAVRWTLGGPPSLSRWVLPPVSEIPLPVALEVM
jgi:hypothetical protein